MHRKRNFITNLFAKKSLSVDGISASDWLTIHNGIVREFNKAKSRQRSADQKPSDYMRGLQYALQLLDQCRPYKLTCESGDVDAE